MREDVRGISKRSAGRAPASFGFGCVPTISNPARCATADSDISCLARWALIHRNDAAQLW